MLYQWNSDFGQFPQILSKEQFRAREKRQRILITEGKIRLLRVDAAHSIQAISWQKEKTTSELSSFVRPEKLLIADSLSR
jgi:hypothetical protein